MALTTRLEFAAAADFDCSCCDDCDDDADPGVCILFFNSGGIAAYGECGLLLSFCQA